MDIRKAIVRRVQKFLYGMENVFDALLFDHVECHPTRLHDGRMDLGIVIHRFHPSYVCGVIRCRWLGDPCGAGLYGKPRSLFEWKTSDYPRWYLRVGNVAVIYWPNEPWYRRLEIVSR